MSQQSKRADLNKAVTLYTKRLLQALTEGTPVEQEELDALNEMREAAGMKALPLAITTQGKAPEPKQHAPQTPRKPPQSAPKPSGGEKKFHRQQHAEAEGAENVSMVPVTINGQHANVHLMDDNAQWTNRFMIRSESSNALYTIAQNKNRRYWGCNCPGWIGHRKCKHLKALGLPFHEQPYEAKLNKGASAKSAAVKFADDNYSELAHILAAELIHSDNELSKMMETVPEIQGEAHIDGPEAGPSNDEFHENTHEESGVPVTDGGLKPTERQNVTAIKDAIEGKAEMEIGKPISVKQEEVAKAEAVRDQAQQNPGVAEVTAKPGTQIIINVAAKKEYEKCDQCGKQAEISKELIAGQPIKKVNCKHCGNKKSKAGALQKVAYVKHCPGHKNSKGESAEWCIYSHETGKILSSHKSESAAKKHLQDMHAHSGSKEASNEGGAWSISGVTPNQETNEDVNKALKRMKATKTAADHVHTPHDIDTVQTVCEYCGIEMEYDGVADGWDCADGSFVDDAMLTKEGAEGIGGENQPGATAGHAGGLFGGVDLQGPDFKVGFTFRGSEREATFSSLKEANTFIKSASVKFGKIAGDWTMKCPACGGSATKQNREDSYVCPQCGWNSHTAAPKKASAKTAKNIKPVTPDPNFVEAMVNAVLTDHAARAMEMDIPLTRVVSIIKTKIKKGTRGNTSVISVYIPENDTEYVMELPKDQAQEGNYSYQPHTAAADPAKRNLVLELLKGNNLTTGEIEKRLGGGKYTNMAYPVLQELAKEGLVKHKQMRWYLKTAERTIMPQETTKQTPGAYGYDRSLSMQTKPIAEDPKGAPSWVTSSKKYRIKSAAPLPSSFSIATRTAEGHPLAGEAGIKTIAEELNKIYADLKRIDPQGYKDSFELQMPSRMMDMAKKHGVQLDHDPSDNTYTFYDQTAAGTIGKSHEELTKESAVNPHTGDPARPEAFDHKQMVKPEICGHEEFRRDWRGEEAIAVCQNPKPCPEHDKQASDKKAGPTKAKRLLQQAARLVHQMKMQNAAGLIDMNEMEGLCAEHATPEEVAKLMIDGLNPQIMFLEQKDADHAMCIACGEALAEYTGDDDDFAETAALKTATIRITSAKPMPRAGTPEAAELKISIQTLKMPEPMQGVMGGPGKEHALRTLAQYGLTWDDADYMAGGKGVKKAGDGMAKTVEVDKEAGFNFFFPGQVLKEFYPEVQHEIVDYPNATNTPMGEVSPEIVGDGGHELEGVLDEALGNTGIVEMIQLPADIGEVEPLAMAAADYSSTSPAGGMGIGRDGKPEVLEGAPLRKENDVRGYMFTDEFYGQYEGVPGAAMQVASKKTAAEGDEKAQFALFLKKVCGEIAATMVAAFKVTSRPLLDKVPGIGELQLDTIEQGQGAAMPLGQITQGGRVKYLMSKLNDSDIKQAINDAWAQAAVWNDNAEGGFVYEVFVRPETIDTDSLQMKYKFVCGTRE